MVVCFKMTPQNNNNNSNNISTPSANFLIDELNKRVGLED
jgi:hypothetical protein